MSESSVSSLLERVSAQCRSVAAAPEKRSIETNELVWSLPGFGAGTQICTSFGYLPIEALRRRDPVKTRDGRFLKVQHVDKVMLDRRYLLNNPDAQPISILTSGLAANVPNRPTLVSGGLKIRSPGKFDQGSGQLAETYLGLSKVSRKHHGYFSYYVFHCGVPCTINANGLWVDLDPKIAISPDD